MWCKYSTGSSMVIVTPSSPLFNKLSITVFIVVDFPAPVGPQKSVNPVFALNEDGMRHCAFCHQKFLVLMN
jgi:hypothetical protein